MALNTFRPLASSVKKKQFLIYLGRLIQCNNSCPEFLSLLLDHLLFKLRLQCESASESAKRWCGVLIAKEAQRVLIEKYSIFCKVNLANTTSDTETMLARATIVVQVFACLNPCIFVYLNPYTFVYLNPCIFVYLNQCIFVYLSLVFVAA